MAVKVRRLFTGRAFKYFVAFVFVGGLTGYQLWKLVTTGRLHIYKSLHSATFAQDPLGFTLSAILLAIGTPLTILALAKGFRHLLIDEPEASTDDAAKTPE